MRVSVVFSFALHVLATAEQLAASMLLLLYIYRTSGGFSLPLPYDLKAKSRRLYDKPRYTYFMHLVNLIHSFVLSPARFGSPHAPLIRHH